MWQHSACHGISKAEAEKEDFHFICHDCQRRAEDAKKPKIPALKFHISSSSSPPSRNVNVDMGANETRKRKSEGEISDMPPIKKFKSPVINPHASDPFAPYVGQDDMHRTMMNGPTLAPPGQVSPMAYQNGHGAQATQPPPGLRSPPPPQVYSNGYINATNQNGHVQAHSSSPPQAPNGASPNNNTSPNPGWSARYSHNEPSNTSQLPQHSNHCPSPYHNSFDRQRPGSSHSTHNLSSPMKNHPSLPPTPSNNSPLPPLFPPTPPANGIETSPHPPSSYSPVKQQSSPPRPAPKLPSSSPISHPPLHLQQNPPSSPGLSPTKHSPPRAPYKSTSFDVLDAPLLPPGPSLEPNGGGLQQGYDAPVKVMPENLLIASNGGESV